MTDRDRGQVVLVGAVSIAFIIVALALLLGSVNYTEQTTTRADVSGTVESSEFEYEAAKTVRSLTIRINHASNATEASTLATAIQDNVTAYESALERSYSGSGATVNLTFQNASTDYGTRIVQDDRRAFVSGNGTDNWNVTWNQDELGWFVLRLNTTTVTPSNPFTIRVQGSSGTATYEFTPAGDDQVNVSYTLPSDSGEVTCSPVGELVALDLLSGTSITSDCALPSLYGLDGPYTVRFENGLSATGRYAVVADGSGTVNSSVDPCVTGSTPAFPCHNPAVWNATVDTTFRSGETVYQNTQRLEIYNTTA